MKKIYLFIVFCVFGINFVFCRGNPEQGNGNVLTENRPVSSSFNTISLEGDILVNVYQNEETKISVTIDSNLSRYVKTNINRGTLTVLNTMPDNVRQTELYVNVYTPNIKELKITGSGNIHIIETIKTDVLKLNISGSGELQGAIECNVLESNITGTGKINISGKGNDLNIIISGSGSIESVNFQVNNARIGITGTGEARVNAINTINGNISGAGKIMYRGNPRIDVNVTGSGQYIKIE